jgi:hypothetical protein
MEFHHALHVLRNSTAKFNLRVHIIARIEMKSEVVVVCWPVGLLEVIK